MAMNLYKGADLLASADYKRTASEINDAAITAGNTWSAIYIKNLLDAVNGYEMDDERIASDKVWSSEKINEFVKGYTTIKTDLNTITEQGLYKVSPGSTHFPNYITELLGGWMICYNVDNSCMQILVSNYNNSSMIFSRLQHSGSTWEAWEKNISSVDLGGDISDLTTYNKTVIPAINELDAENGNLLDLNTDAKDTLVNAINEVNENVGDLTDLSTSNKNDVVGAINELAADGGNPTGTIIIYSGTTTNIPQGFLVCNGQTVSRTTYAKLFNVIGTTYGAGDGSTTFTLPDLRDKVPVGAGYTYSLATKGGEASHTLTSTEMPSHTHTFTGTSHTHSTYSAGSGSITGLRVREATSSTSSSGVLTVNTGSESWNGMSQVSGTSFTGFSIASHTHSLYSTTAGGTNSSTGGNSSHNNMQPYIALNYLIKY